MSTEADEADPDDIDCWIPNIKAAYQGTALKLSKVENCPEIECFRGTDLHHISPVAINTFQGSFPNGDAQTCFAVPYDPAVQGPKRGSDALGTFDTNYKALVESAAPVAVQGKVFVAKIDELIAFKEAIVTYKLGRMDKWSEVNFCPKRYNDDCDIRAAKAMKAWWASGQTASGVDAVKVQATQIMLQECSFLQMKSSDAEDGSYHTTTANWQGKMSGYCRLAERKPVKSPVIGKTDGILEWKTSSCKHNYHCASNNCESENPNDEKKICKSATDTSCLSNMEAEQQAGQSDQNVKVCTEKCAYTGQKGGACQVFGSIGAQPSAEGNGKGMITWTAYDAAPKSRSSNGGASLCCDEAGKIRIAPGHLCSLAQYCGTPTSPEDPASVCLVDGLLFTPVIEGQPAQQHSRSGTKDTCQTKPNPPNNPCGYEAYPKEIGAACQFDCECKPNNKCEERNQKKTCVAP